MNCIYWDSNKIKRDVLKGIIHWNFNKYEMLSFLFNGVYRYKVYFIMIYNFTCSNLPYSV